jgi:perosamine synthetase
MMTDHSEPRSIRRALPTPPNRVIRVAEPRLHGNEEQYVLDALRRNDLAHGTYVRRFEQAWAAACGVEHGISCTSGTSALILALHALDLQPGDEVIVPTLTYIATANAVTYFGARPVFVDVDPTTWCLDPDLVSRAVGSRTRGAIAVHLYGRPADVDGLRGALGPGRFLVEDAAEAHGALYKGRPVGGLADIGCFSFYGNKVLTTGEGGMAVTQRGELAAAMRAYRDTFHDTDHRYVHRAVGFNFRLSNLAAAVGLGQVEDLAWHLARRREVANWYAEYLAEVPGVRLQGCDPVAEPCHWMVTVCLDTDFGVDRDALLDELWAAGIECRPVFHPLHRQPPYRTAQVLPVSESLAANGFNLPTHSSLSRADVERVVGTLRDLLGRRARRAA